MYLKPFPFPFSGKGKEERLEEMLDEIKENGKMQDHRIEKETKQWTEERNWESKRKIVLRQVQYDWFIESKENFDEMCQELKELILSEKKWHDMANRRGRNYSWNKRYVSMNLLEPKVQQKIQLVSKDSKREFIHSLLVKRQ